MVQHALDTSSRWRVFRPAGGGTYTARRVPVRSTCVRTPSSRWALYMVPVVHVCGYCTPPREAAKGKNVGLNATIFCRRRGGIQFDALSSKNMLLTSTGLGKLFLTTKYFLFRFGFWVFPRALSLEN